jgi:hypothetical protein
MAVFNMLYAAMNESETGRSLTDGVLDASTRVLILL